jgi:predicted amidohydrolase
MRAALATFVTAPESSQNLARMLERLHEAASAGAALVVFAEAAPTGWVHTGRDAENDRGLAWTVCGPEVEQLRSAARALGLWVGFGLLERAGQRLHDAALLLDSGGQTALHYRRVSPGWRWPDASPEYQEGTEVPVAVTPFGRVVFLLCGDAFAPGVAALAQAARPDLLLLPFARGFDEDAPDVAAWQQEPQMYAETLAEVAPVTLAVNSLGQGMVGGAFVLASGVVHAVQAIRAPGLLLIDLDA